MCSAFVWVFTWHNSFYQMHGLFEMHFFAFIGSAILITYQNWKLQIPMLVFVVIHHLGLNYLQSVGYGGVYFTNFDYLERQTIAFHIVLTAAIFFICGLWSYHLNKYNGSQLSMIVHIQERKQHEEVLKRLNSALLVSTQEAMNAKKDAENAAQAFYSALWATKVNINIRSYLQPYSTNPQKQNSCVASYTRP